MLTDLYLGKQGDAQYDTQQLAEDDPRRKRSTVLLKMLPHFSVPNFTWSIYKGAFTVSVLARVRSLFAAIDEVESRNVYKTAFLTQMRPLPHGHPDGTEVERTTIVSDCSDSPALGGTFDYTRSLREQIVEGFNRKIAQTKCCERLHVVKTTYADVLVVQSMRKSQWHNDQFKNLEPAISFYNESYWVDPRQQQIVDREIELNRHKYTLRAAVILVCMRAGLVCHPGAKPLAGDCFHAAAVILRGDEFYVVDSDLSTARYRSVGLERLIAGAHLFVYSRDESSLPKTVADDSAHIWEKLQKMYERQDAAEKELQESKQTVYVVHYFRISTTRKQPKHAQAYTNTHIQTHTYTNTHTHTH